jgi:NAD(P)-dependent dehydrogenase (short-subunit alcohol dehydrogenase family)
LKINQQHGAVLITGTSTGIGRATALHLDQLGYQVFATVRKERDAASLRSQASERLTPLLLDVTDEVSISQAEEVVSQVVGDAGLMGLVNNAAVAFVSPLEFAPLDEMRWLFEVNFFGLLAVTQKFLPLLRQAHGRIVNVSSTASVVVAPFHGPYSASKLALNGLSDALRLELRPLGVKVSVIIYGSVKTPIWDKGGGTSGQIIQDYPAQAWDLYGANYRVLVDYFRRMGKSGISTEEATRPILHALSAKRPKTRYYVGRDARQFYILSKLLSGRLHDWVIMRTIGLSDKNEAPNMVTKLDH